MDYLVIMQKNVPDETNPNLTWGHEARDTVEDYKLEEYVADAKTRWDSVEFTPKEN